MNTTVKVHGVPYRVLEARALSACGSKYFGKCRFLLEAPDGSRWEAFGKSVAWNTRLVPSTGSGWTR